MNILITGAAGFIGFHLAKTLLDQKIFVLGIDSLNDYYDPLLKKSRIEHLRKFPSFQFIEYDLAKGNLEKILPNRSFDCIIHLAAYAGVRYSLDHPRLYLENNVLGHLALLDWVKSMPIRPYFIYASSSSVYGGCPAPFKETEKDLRPLSPYAVSKRSIELLSDCYSSLHAIDQTGLRFFTVYGPWGRPDMAYFKFVDAIWHNRKIIIHGDGTMRRDFTYIDDIIEGILAALHQKPAGHKIYNLGNDKPESVHYLVECLEDALEKKAIREYGHPLPGEVPTTWADLSLSRKELKFNPKTKLNEGISRFVEWYKDYYIRDKIGK